MSRQRIPEPQLFNSRSQAIISAVAIGVLLFGLALLHIEYPNGLADFHGWHVTLISSNH